MKNFLLLFVWIFVGSAAVAQIVTLDPPFATQNDEVTITFDATQGNGDLQGFVPVYIHTGVILDGQTGWQNVPTDWDSTTTIESMIPLGNNLHQKTINITEFYDLEEGDVVLQLAFVFRNADGTVVGRDEDGGDIFVDLFQNEYTVSIFQPLTNQVILDPQQTIDISAGANEQSEITLFVNETEILSQPDVELVSTSITAGDYPEGLNWIFAEATNGSVTVRDSVYFVLQGDVNVAEAPDGLVDGINYTPDGVFLQLYAPNKDFVYAVGDFSNWQLMPEYFMNRTPDGNRYWVQIEGLDPDEQYAFQYHIDEEGLRIADPYAELVLNPFDDPGIPSSTYPNLKPYPSGQTGNNFEVSVIHINQPDYTWQTNDFERPEREKLVIYELLVRDFIAAHDWQTLTDTLGYLERLGVNAIELMPFNEFEGNESWGYNPSFYFAPDKYYGTKNALKSFIDACHARGIAVIMDIVPNHSFGRSPLVRLYATGDYGPPSAENPWHNVNATHPFNVGYDFNHESVVTQQFFDRVFKFWIEEYRIDGYRFDLSKGITQTNTGSNVGLWSQYDQSRIDLWARFKSEIDEYDPEAILILEHFADLNEEQALSNMGFMLWGNRHFVYNEASMGYLGQSNFSNMGWQQAGFAAPNLVGYAESHDEERLMYKNIEFGNSSGDYDITELETALERQELVTVFSVPVPGPKMSWQFMELGYDYSINYCPDGTINNNCRTANKPIRWDYYDEPERQRLYKITAAVNKLKTTYESFSTDNYEIYAQFADKRIRLFHPEMDVIIVGNFDVVPANVFPQFTSTGTWYDYFSGEAISVTDQNMSMSYQPGEYHIYTNQPLPVPDVTVSTEELSFGAGEILRAWPNPANDRVQLSYQLVSGRQLEVVAHDITGRQVATLYQGYKPSGLHVLDIATSELGGKPGVYLLTIRSEGQSASTRVVVTR